jgi:hypothetical protein
MDDGSYQINSRAQNKIIGSGFRSQERDMYGNDADEEMRANFSAQGINDDNADTEVNQSRNNFRQITHSRQETFSVNMGVSFEEMNSYVSKCNIDFKENIIKQAHTIKLKHTSELNKWVSNLLFIISYHFINLIKIGRRIETRRVSRAWYLK